MSLDPAVARGRLLVRGALDDIPAGHEILMAVSGGADSLALAAVTAFEARAAGWALRAMIVDHRLQTQSTHVARRASEQLAELGVDARIVEVTVGDQGGPEAAARDARYAALDADPAEVILLAHTLDDQAETVLLGLGRGSGPRAIAGMRAETGRYRRPLLAMRRTDTEQICRAHGLSWWDDPHNADPRYRRVRIRNEVLPLLEEVLGGGVVQALGRTAEQVSADVDFLDALAERHNDLAVDALTELPRSLRLRVLHRSAVAAGAAADELAFTHIRAIDTLITGWRGQRRIELPGHVCAKREGDRITFGPTPMAG